jgi:hypothetical protein
MAGCWRVSVELIVERTAALGLQGKVTISHVLSRHGVDTILIS